MAGRAPIFHYRLRVDVEGVERSFLLAAGASFVGSQPGNAVVIQAPGVSRRHVAITVDGAGEPLLEDQGSKNGTFVNRRRTRCCRLGPGDEVTLGSARLVLERLAPDESELAIAMADDEPTTAGPGSGESTLEHGSADDAWLRLLDRVAERLSGSAGSDAGGALEVLVEALGAAAGSILEWSRASGPVVLAARGERIDAALADGLRSCFELARGDGGFGVRTEIDPPRTCAVRFAAEADPRALVLWGDFPGRDRCEPLLKMVLRLLDLRFPGGDVGPGRAGTAGSSGLCFPPGYIPAVSSDMAAFYRRMRSLLDVDLPILIVGETGVGKEFLAHMLHASSSRRAGPLVAINCAALPDELLEAEMFGIGKSVATGVAPRRGRFQAADGGTLFLDEVGEMSAACQAKLLRALQEKEIQPLGEAPRRVDVRVVAATNADLPERAAAGTFRRDLYYRIAGQVLHVPPLRERPADIPVLVEGFLRRAAERREKKVRGVTLKALRELVGYPWPGNVRELKHEIGQLASLCPHRHVVDSSMLSDHLRGHEAPLGNGASGLELKPRVQDLERRLIHRALEYAGNQKQAARLLGIARNTLRAKLKQLGMT